MSFIYEQMDLSFLTPVDEASSLFATLTLLSYPTPNIPSTPDVYTYLELPECRVRAITLLAATRDGLDHYTLSKPYLTDGDGLRKG